ncbi:GLPGLI family protein [Spongiivirga citrea]|uniref:GLPGLI family protein n=1 Tax=Spongiivirga citrea TaxID=1481457 RepID=A0A6M0CYL9_9FLAO|nr:GLPGLI family protein [Spongiivirga citrea]NER18830.1 GLPGLI family protein [Spongiivirga citrea]
MKTTITLLLAFFSVTVFSQDFQGKAYYFSKTGVDMNFGNRQLSPEMQKQIAERMKSMLEKTYILTFDKSSSTYKEEEQLDAPGSGGGGRWRGMMSSFSSANYYKEIKEGNYYDQREFFGKNFLIKDTLPKLQWKMVNETKKIGNYTCFKATAMKKVDELDWRNMRRRRGNRNRNGGEVKNDSVKKVTEEIEVPKEIEVVAWYSPEIPVSQGPGEYWGLPGLILEVQSGRTTLLCSKIVMNSKEKEILEKPSKGKEVSQQEFNDIAKQKMQEMRDQWGGRNRGGGRRGF